MAPPIPSGRRHRRDPEASWTVRRAVVGATGREAGVAHQRHGCEPAGRLYGTPLWVRGAVHSCGRLTTTRSSRKTGPAGATHREMIFSARLGPPLVTGLHRDTEGGWAGFVHAPPRTFSGRSSSSSGADPPGHWAARAAPRRPLDTTRSPARGVALRPASLRSLTLLTHKH